MKEYVVSNTTGKRYAPVDAVRLLNPRQAAAYMLHGAKLLDIYPSTDFKTGDLVLVYLFNRLDTTPLYDKWCKHELGKEGLMDD